jgi:hypothetical protein
VKRYTIVILVILSIFCANLFAVTDVFLKGGSHNNFCSLHKHEHTHNTLEHTHSHNHKVSIIDFYITESIQIEPFSYIEENNFDFIEQYKYNISQELFRPPIV